MKKVIVRDKSDIVILDDVSNSKIYAVFANGSIYKAHNKINDESFNFICCGDSTNFHGFGNCLRESIKSLIMRGIDVYEFTSEIEFFEWALETLK